MSGRCRLCTANDKEALIEELAAEMWNLRRDYHNDPAWEDCGSYWQEVFRGFACATVALLDQRHG